MPCAPALSRASLSILLVGLAGAGCAGSPAIRAAETGRFDGLRASLSADLERGRLGKREAVSFAHAIARGEVERAQGEEGAQRVRELRGCARALDGELDRRADTHDTIGAVAALLRVEAGLDSAERYVQLVHTSPLSPAAAWRAIGARALVAGDDGALRRRLIADPDQEVRRSALRAALEAGDPDDTEAVLEAARVDPYPAARAQAVRAAGAIGGERAVLALADLWPRVDEPVRRSIVEAWATAGSFDAGGRRELLRVVERQHGAPALEAALVLVRAGGEGAPSAQGMLEAAVKEGPTANRVRAVELAPLAVTPLREAVLKAESDPDEAVAVAALTRRFEAPSDQGGGGAAHDELGAKLLKAAQGMGAGAAAAKATLARAHDQRLVPILEHDGQAKDQAARAEAGAALAVLGDLPRAAVVAADPEPRVRIPVACAILRASSGE